MKFNAGGDPLRGGQPTVTSKRRVSPVFWLFVFPVLLVMLAAATRFNQDLAAIQKLVANSLVQAASESVDQGQVYRIHTVVVNLLADLEPRLLDLENLQEHSDVVKKARQDFLVYRDLIITATDLAKKAESLVILQRQGQPAG